MAKEKVSVSQHIRDVLSEDPGLKAPEIIATLERRGVTAKPALVYYVKARDQQGNIRSGWVRCGSWWWGLWSDQTQVRWENET